MTRETGEPDEAAEPGMPGNPVTITDPRMMRALAHQARIAIWMHLGLHGPATATECAEIAGLSPSACSYHLRTLAKYGFVEEDPDSAADGRERPWRARLLAFNMRDTPGAPAARRAAGPGAARPFPVVRPRRGPGCCGGGSVKVAWRPGPLAVRSFRLLA